MSQLAVTNETNISQPMILQFQEILQASDDKIEGEYVHYFAPGIYCRVLKIPGGMYAIGKAHKTVHLTMLIKGKASFTDSNGDFVLLQAPFITTSQANQKKMVYCHEECWFVNIHPSTTTDLDEIEKQVIMSETEFKLMIAAEQNTLLEAKETLCHLD